MLSARSIYDEILGSDAAYQLMMSTAAAGETQGGWENERIAALTRDPELAAKIQRHGDDENKHGRLFLALLRKRNLELAPVPDDVHYTKILEKQGIGLSHARLREERPLSDEEIIKYLVHSRVTEERAAEEVDQQLAIFRDHPDLGRPIAMIADDEANHLSYTHEELQRFVSLGHGDAIRRMLEEYAMAEIRTYRDVSLGVVRRTARILGWSFVKRALIATGIHVIYWRDRLWGWRRFVTILPPKRPGAMSPRRAPAAATT